MNTNHYLLFTVILTLTLLTLTPAVRAHEPIQTQAAPTLGGCPVLPVDNIWNTPVDTLPVDANSTTYINTISGVSANVHADFGSGVWPPGSNSPIGIPYVIVPSNQISVTINIVSSYPAESDPGPYPIPANAPIEGGPNSNGDRHVPVIRQGECRLYELYRAFPQPNGSWNADLRPFLTSIPTRSGQTAIPRRMRSGLPILPGLVRYDEVTAGEINHALRFTALKTRKAYVWPARHYASNLTDSQYPPMGQRFRLKASFVIDNSFSPHAQTILRALKKYGMILADNGSSWYISGTPNPNWDNDVLHELDVVEGSDFEAVNVSSLMVSPNSGQVKGFTVSPTPATQVIEVGQSAAFVLNFTTAGSFSSTVYLNTLSPPPGLLLNFSPNSLTPPGQATLILTDTHVTGSFWHTIAITATGGSFTRTVSVNLLVGGARTYLPTILK